ncbi:alpha/beta hydrolase fold domain-containing protein [Nocardia cyriacigeorgica]|uniref:alpha/beta hydrolase fold domain-containing protein n=1 Tax=Nocardia cyriacigeorgica TaxID=135487 RepID=UPI002457C1CA|nr:alpha/beta hydrolase fold domain-containing protein [Nocardia cyriacigeorgica]
MTVTAQAPAPAQAPAALSVAERLQRAAFTALGSIPGGLLRRIAPRVVNADGDVMAPEIALLLKATASAPDFSDGTPEQARAMVANDSRVFADKAPAGVRVEPEIVLPTGLRATMYRPAAPSNALVLFLHGGGFVLSSRQDYDVPVRLIADGAGVNVLSVEYGLAPESPFPGPVDDAVTAWRFAVDHCAQWGIDPARIVLLGDSAGGNLCAVLANIVAGEQVRPFLQVLMYPVVDAVGNYASRKEFADNAALSAKQIDWLTDLYLPDRTYALDPRVSPILADDLSGTPPTLITVAGFDPLRDEALAYAARLEEAGIPVRVFRESGLVHGYVSMTRISPTARAALDRVTDAVRTALEES